MKYNVNEIMDLVKEVLGEDADGIYLNQNDFDDGENNLYSTEDGSYVISEWSINYCTRHGLSRFVIIPDEGDYVIKLPITGIYDFVDSEDEEGDWIREMRIVAKADDTCDDPTEDEICFYNNASKAIKQVLLPNIFIGAYNGIPVYIQRKITETYDSSKNSYRPLSLDEHVLIKRTMTKATKIDDCYPPCPDAFTLDIINFYGAKKAESMLKFLYERNDLHGGNIGYIDGRPVVFDYGGFNGEDYLWIWQ